MGEINGGEVVIFGQQVLSYDEFKKAIQSKMLSNNYITNFKTALEGIMSDVINLQNGKASYKDDSTAQLLFNRWEAILKEYVSPSNQPNQGVSLLTIGRGSGGELIFSQLEQESEKINRTGVMVRARSLMTQIKKLREEDKKLDNLQKTLNNHYSNLKTYLSYQISQPTRDELIEKAIIKKSAAAYSILTNHKYQLGSGYPETEDESYERLVFGSSQDGKKGQQEGKRIEAFMSHVAQYHVEVLSYLQDPSNIPENYQISNDWPAIFSENNVANTWSWLYGSLNSRPWFTGGDIIVTTDGKNIAFNIQIKAGARNKTQTLAIQMLATEINNLINLLDQEKLEQEKGPENFIRKLFNVLKTDVVSKVEETYTKYTEEKLIKSQFQDHSHLMNLGSI